MDYCIILAGGIGARLWPASRPRRPKQFLDLLGTGRTLLQGTYDRMSALFPPERIIISTCAEQADMVREQLPEAPESNILAEPVRRGTMPAAFWANTVITERDPDACVICVTADQIVLRERQFEQDVRAALAFVGERRCPLTLAVPAARPETFYGYIQAEAPEDGFAPVKAFTEKPSAEFARMFVESGEFYWNTGINVWHAATMQHSLSDVDGDYKALLLSERDRSGEPLSSVIRRQFGRLPNMSLDLTIQERIGGAWVRVCSFGWADIGNWHSMHEDMPADRNGNVCLHSRALLYGCSGNVIKMPEGTTVVMQDIHDKVVVAHDGVLFIAPKDNYGEMRRVMTDAQVKIGE